VHKGHDGEIEQPLGLDWHGFKFALAAFTFSPSWLWKNLRFMFAAARGDLSQDGFFKSGWLQRVVPETAPLGPTIDTISPWAIWQLTPLSTCKLPYDL